MEEDEAPYSDSDSISDEDAAALGLEEALPDFYDPEADEKNEKWMHKMRKGRISDAILSCPSCLTTVCIDCQQHATYDNQFRAMLVMNCRVETKQVVKPVKPAPGKPYSKSSSERRKEDIEQVEKDVQEPSSTDEQYNPVHCAVCDTEVGLRELPPSGVYHFFNVIPSLA